MEEDSSAPTCGRVSWAVIIVNVALAQACVYASVSGGMLGRPWTGALIALGSLSIHVFFTDRRVVELGILLSAGAFGSLVEILEQQFGFFVFSQGGLLPAWVALVWMGLGAMLRFAFQGLSRQIWLAALTGGIGGGFAFFAAEQAQILSVAGIGGYAGLAVSSAIALPGLIVIRRWWDALLEPGHYRFLSR